MKILLRIIPLVALMVFYAAASHAADDFLSMFKDGKPMGQIRTFYIDRNYNKTYSANDRSAFAIGGKVGYETGEFERFKAGVMLYTSNALDTNRTEDGKPNTHMDPTLFGHDREAVTYIGQLYMQYAYANTTFKLGRQELKTPLEDMDDARMLPNLFEGVVVTNTDIPNTQIIINHMWSMAYGTFSNAYVAGSTLAIQAGYGYDRHKSSTIAGRYDTGYFKNMGTQAIGESNPGVTSIAAIYTGIPDLTLQIWDYYAYEMLNAAYLQGDYTMGFGGVKTILSAQYINESNVGNNVKDVLGKNVGSNLFAAKLAVKPIKDLTLYGAYSITPSDMDKALNGGLITPWGASPGFVQGTVTRLAYTADTDAWKLGASYDVIEGLNLHLSYTYFNVGDKAVYFDRKAIRAKDAGETDFDVIYKVKYVKNLELKLRGIYARDFIPYQDFTEYRLIANYNF